LILLPEFARPDLNSFHAHLLSTSYITQDIITDHHNLSKDRKNSNRSYNKNNTAVNIIIMYFFIVPFKRLSQYFLGKLKKFQ